MIEASSLRRGPGRPPRDARQLDLNFRFGELRLHSSEDRDSNVNDAVDGEHGIPNSSEGTMLQNHPRFFYAVSIASGRLDVDGCSGQSLLVDRSWE